MRRKSLCLVIVLVCAAPAAAEDTLQLLAMERLDRVDVEAVAPRKPQFERSSSTASRTDTPLRDLPQSVAVVTQQQIEERADHSLNEVLQRVGGVSVTMGEGRRDQVAIRGFSALYDQLWDGVRNDAPYYRDLANVAAVEVLKGPAAALYGRGSSGGIVNLVTKKPLFGAPLRESALGLGAYGWRRGSLDVGATASDTVAWRANVAAESGGSFRNHYTLQRQLAAPALDWRYGADGELLLQAELLRDRRTPDRGLTGLGARPAPVSIGTSYGDPLGDHLDTDAAQLKAVWQQGLGADWRLRSTLAWFDVDSDFSNTYATRPSADGLRVERGQYDAATVQGSRSGQFELLGALGRGALRQQLLFGAALGWQDKTTQRHTGSAPTLDLFDPDLSQRPSYSGVLAADSDFSGRVLGLYVQDQIDLGAQWKALAGLRWDRLHQRQDDLLRPTLAPLQRTDTATSPRLGLVWQPSAAHAVYVSASRSFQPSGEGLALAANNADLEPETSALLETGYKGDWFDGRLGASAAVFRLERDHIKTADPNDPTRLIPVGQQLTRGAELGLQGRVGARWKLDLALTWLDAAITRSTGVSNGVALQGRRPANVAPRSASLWSSLDLDAGLTLALGAVASAVRYSANDNLVALPGYVRLDGALIWRRGADEFALNLKNLGDTRYYESAHTTHQIMPGAPRTAYVTWRRDWP